VRLAHEQGDLAAGWESPRAACLGELALGLVERDRKAAESRFAAAAELAADIAPLERIAALIELGRTLRQRRERARAREPLREALTDARERGAVRLAGHAEAELLAARGRPPKSTQAGDELTPSERRIADLAAAGTSNREIAAALFLSVRTVETHLTSVYRRLGIGSRRELPDALTHSTGEEAQLAAG
jgi:DNA-binding CsgD family transcriptional regulator